MLFKLSGVSRRRVGLGGVLMFGLGLAGCGGGGLDPLGLGDDDDSEGSGGGNEGGGGSAGGQPLYDAFLALRPDMRLSDVEKRVPGTASQGDNDNEWRWETSTETLVVRFIGNTISEAIWTDRTSDRTERRAYVFTGGGGGSGSGAAQTLYDMYKALRPGMTKSQVVASAPVSPSQGIDTDQVLWVLGEEALGVKFNGTSNSSVITFAQWGLSIAAGGRNESRSF